MKSLIVFALVAVMLTGVICDFDDDDHGCQTDNHCEYDECCMQSPYPGRFSKVCVDKGDDIGDRCGGPYACSTCDKGLTCVKDAQGYGTCQGSARFYNRF